MSTTVSSTMSADSTSSSISSSVSRDSSLRNPIFVVLLFCVGLGAIVLLVVTLPVLPPAVTAPLKAHHREQQSVVASESIALAFPSSLEDVKDLSAVLSRHVEHHFFHVLVLYCVAYLWKQSFAVPGSGLLNVLGGALFGYWGFPIVCVLTASGSTMCYWISGFYGKRLLERYAMGRLVRYRALVRENEDNLFLFMMGLRIVPIVPNWMINIASPHVGILWIHIFFPALFGLMPYNFLFVQAGQIVQRLSSTGEILDTSTVIQFALAGLVIMGISVFQRRISKSRSKK